VEDTDVDADHHLVQLQNILPLFIYGVNSDGSRSVQLAVIGDHRLTSDSLSPHQTAESPSSEDFSLMKISGAVDESSQTRNGKY